VSWFRGGLADARTSRNARRQGFTLAELLGAVSVLGVLLAIGAWVGRGLLATQRVEVAVRELASTIERQRDLAIRHGHGRSVSVDGPGGLLEAATVAGGQLEISHNLPPELRFTANGLLIDGGTVVVASAGTSLRRCLVMALPLGVVRLGRDESGGGGVSASTCVRDERA
jgi:prepilin-type N-terminal cleavage/methylation domain-containing protein